MEQDPNGLTSDTPGAKLDEGKPKCAQILRMFSHALWEVSKIGTFGANKYTMGGWQHVVDGENRYADADMRHFLEVAMSGEVDGDSELLHLAHRAWNVLAELELHIRRKNLDERQRESTNDKSGGAHNRLSEDESHLRSRENETVGPTGVPC